MKEKEIPTKDKVWIWLSEFFMFTGAISIGKGIDTMNWFLIIGGTINALLWYGSLTLYIAKYNIKPFWYNLYPKTIKEEFP